MKIDKKKIKEIYKRYKKGKSFREIAKEYNTYHYIISAIIKTYEIFLEEEKQLIKTINEKENEITKTAIVSFLVGIIFTIIIVLTFFFIKKFL